MGRPPLPQTVEPPSDQLAMELAVKVQHQEQMKNKWVSFNTCDVDAEAKLLKQKRMLCETERNIVELDDTVADLRKRIWPSLRVSPRVQSVDEEMFSAKEEQ